MELKEKKSPEKPEKGVVFAERIQAGVLVLIGAMFAGRNEQKNEFPESTSSRVAEKLGERPQIETAKLPDRAIFVEIPAVKTTEVTLPLENAMPVKMSKPGISTRPGAASHVADFCAKYGGFALEVEKRYGVPAEVCLAQAAHETGWGKRVVGNNFFGIKPSGEWEGDTITTGTHEYRKGKKRSEKSHFRGYDSAEQSFQNYGEFLHRNPRYRNALTKQGDAQGCIRELAKAGYATDPKYAAKVIAIMRLFERTAAP